MGILFIFPAITRLGRGLEPDSVAACNVILDPQRLIPGGSLKFRIAQNPSLDNQAVAAPSVTSIQLDVRPG